MSLPLFHVDTFAHSPFAGNAAAICLLDAPRDDAWLQRVASEMNLAATAFLSPQDDGYRLRWFSPQVELELCGHGTLASAHTLWEQGYLALDAQAIFYTKGGRLTAQRVGDWIELDFPAKPEAAAEILPIFQECLDITPRYVGKSQLDYVVEVAAEADVRALQPDFRLLATLPARGIIVTAAANDAADYDFVSRFFCPSVGITKIRSQGRRTVSLGHSGASGWGVSNSSAIRCRRVVASCASTQMATGCVWVGRRSPCCAANCLPRDTRMMEATTGMLSRGGK